MEFMAVARAFPWLMVAATVILTSYGQLVLKWQSTITTPPPFSFMKVWPPVIQMLARPWVISALVAAFGASLCWMVALSKLEINKAYPFMALNFLLVCLLAVPLFGENFGLAKAGGLALIVVGLVLISQS